MRACVCVCVCVIPSSFRSRREHPYHHTHLPVQSGRDANSPKAEDNFIPRQTFELNPSHPIIIRLNTLRTTNPPHAILIAEQLFDNALVAAGLLDDPRTMLPRLTQLLQLLSGEAGAPMDVAREPEAVSPYPAEAEEKAVQDFMHEAFSDAVMSKGLPKKE